MRSILTIVPARGGSKGVPRKNMRMLCGKPLIAWTIEKALQLDTARCIVSTDSPELAEIAREHGAEVPFLRPKELSGDNASLLQVMNHALLFFDAAGARYDAVLSLQATTPLLSVDTARKAIDMFHERHAQCVVSISEIRQGHPVLAKRILPDGTMQDFCAWPPDMPRYPRQAREPAFYASGGLFLRDRALIESMDKGTNGFGNTPLGIAVSQEESINIDDPFDFEIAELLLRKELLQ